MSKFIVDASLFPLVFIKYPQETTVAEIDSYIKELYPIAQRGKFAAIIDFSNVQQPNPLIRSYFAKKIDLFELNFPKVVLADALVSPSPFHRGLLTAHLWLKPPRHPMKVFADNTKALAWIRKILADAGLKAG